MIAERGEDAERQHLRYIKQINAALVAKPPTMSITTHSCRGNFQSYWAAEGGYDFVAEALFNELNVDGFFLEYDDARSGDFKPLRFMPKGKMVVLGLVTTKRGDLESKTNLSAGWTRRAITCRSTRFASPRNAVFLRRWTATGFLRRRSGQVASRGRYRPRCVGLRLRATRRSDTRSSSSP